MVSSFDQPLPTETMYVPAKNGVRYADGKISSILPDKSGALMEIITEGIYSLRIVDHSGAVVKKIFTDVLMQKKTETIYFQKENLNKGLYYLQLFKENELVHFHELELK